MALMMKAAGTPKQSYTSTRRNDAQATGLNDNFVFFA
jgi:hypothetical protein